MRTKNGKGLGWHREYADLRDYSPATESVAQVLGRSKSLKTTAAKLATSVDLRKWCSPIEDQGALGSCTAQAAVAMMEYFARRTSGSHIDGSRLFLYKVTRQLIGFSGDDGAYLRDTMKAMVLFGIPPEKFWPYDIDEFNVDPNPFCFAYAQNYKAIEYYRLDPPGLSGDKVLGSLRKNLAAGLPAMFGFSVYDSIYDDDRGNIPFPTTNDSLIGGHAVLAVGYDDSRKIGKHKGALLIRNSWGLGWGEDGYGWLPYAYVEQGLANDFWSMVKADYVNSDLFK